MATKVLVEAMAAPKSVDTRRGPALTYSFKGNDGQWYKMGFKKPTFDKGDTVEFEFNSGMYGNEVTTVLSVTKADGSAAPVAPAKPAWGGKGGGGGGFSRGVFPIPPTDGQRSIIRQNALTNARELIMAMEMTTGNKIINTVVTQDALADAIIRISKKFEAYTAGDNEAAAARKALDEKK